MAILMHDEFRMKTLSEEFGFYTHHPEEMDEVFYGEVRKDTKVIRALFDFIQDDEFLRMFDLAKKIEHSASEQAENLTTQVRNKMRELIGPLVPKGRKNKIEDHRSKRSDWYCGLEIQKAGFCSIEAWVDISTESNSLIARTFLWTLEVAPDDIRNEVFRGIALPQALANDDPQSLIIGEVDLRDAFDRNVTIDKIVEELTRPLSQLKADDWSKLHLLAPQRTNKSVQSSSAARRSAR